MTCCDARSALLLGLHLPFPCMRVCTRALCYLSSCLPCSCSHLLFSSCRCRCRALYACQLSGTLPAALIDGRPGLNTLAVRCGVAGRHPRLVPCRRFSTLLSLPAALHFVLACLKTGVLPPACQSSLITSRCNLLLFAACLNPQCCLQHYAPLTPTMRSFNTTASMGVCLRAGRDQMCDQDQLCISQHLPLHAASLLLHGVTLLACMAIAVLPAHIHWPASQAHDLPAARLQPRFCLHFRSSSPFLQLEILALTDNALTGPAFPPAWLSSDALLKLEHFDIELNPALTGTLPASLPWRSLQTL